MAALIWLALGSNAMAQDKPLPVTTIVIDTDHGPHTFRVEIAADHASQEKGLMFRKQMAPDDGMLFEFPKPEMEYFWMKNTILPLDIIFIRANGTISSIAPNAVPYSTTTIPIHRTGARRARIERRTRGATRHRARRRRASRLLRHAHEDLTIITHCGQ